MAKNYCLIGDIHSQDVPLRKALDYCEQLGLTPLLLGDLFDSRRSSYSNSLGVYEQAIRAEGMGGVILQSNHQNKLIRYLRGRNVLVKGGLDSTINELFGNNGLDKQRVSRWLEEFPYALKIRVADKEYRLAHAYFPDSLICDPSQDYEAFGYHRLTDSEKSSCMYGISKRISGQKERISWWEDDSYRNDGFVRVSGHYHSYAINIWSMILDGQCGTEMDCAKLIVSHDLHDNPVFKEFTYD